MLRTFAKELLFTLLGWDRADIGLFQLAHRLFGHKLVITLVHY